MHDSQVLLRTDGDAVTRLARRRFDLDSETLGELVARRKDLGHQLDKLRGEANRLAKQAGREPGGAPAELREQSRQLKERLHELESEHRVAEAAVTEFLLSVPNLPADEAPDGVGDDDAVELRRVGEPRIPDFPVRHHADLGERTGQLDLRRAAKLSGARFSVTRGPLAAMHRALASFLLDLHTGEHGYVEYTVPTLVTRETMTGTGQLPKFEADLFRTSVGDRELFLIPTAEVPLVNLFAGETLPAADLPLALTAHTPCFRSEAGSYGRDTRGIFRLHEFGKVELVRICRPEDSRRELDLLVGHAEECLRRLELAYRVVTLAAGDLGFSAHVTHDIEVWLPSQGRYREISSCSDCGQFQARRARIRVKDRSGGKTFAATLNGSGLPIGRTLIALLEQHQDADGGVRVPDALVPYTGFRRIAPDGRAER
ncbi:MAG TPA: serine--tRNA ligase [Pseudonocardiaceae bacterium]